MDLVTRLDLFSLGRAYVLQKSTKIDPSQVDVEGSDVNIFVGSQSIVGDKIVKQLGGSVSRLFLDGAKGDDLDRLIYDRTGGEVRRKGAAAALGAVQFSRLSFAAGAGTIPVNTLIQALTGTQYRTTSVANFGPTDLTSTANVIAVQAGKATQVGANALVTFSKPSLIFDRTITVTNPNPTAGGEDREEDDNFRERGRAFFKSARRGIAAAIEQGALAVPGVVTAQAVEALDDLGRPARLVQLFIADSTGVASVQLAQLVTTSLNDYRAAGIFVTVIPSIPLIVSILLKLAFAANIDTVTLSDLVIAAVVSYVNSLPVNATLTISGLQSVLQRFVRMGLVVSSNSIVQPTGDLVPPIGQTIRCNFSSVTLA